MKSWVSLISDLHEYESETSFQRPLILWENVCWIKKTFLRMTSHIFLLSLCLSHNVISLLQCIITVRPGQDHRASSGALIHDLEKKKKKTERNRERELKQQGNTVQFFHEFAFQFFFYKQKRITALTSNRIE